MPRYLSSEIVNALIRGDKHYRYKYLVKHNDKIKVFHEKVRNRICPICGKKFKTLASLKHHLTKGVCGYLLLELIREAEKQRKPYEYIADKILELPSKYKQLISKKEVVIA